jgi:hypothetical protein
VNSSTPSRSPLTASPLRTAGQSLTEEIQDVGYDGILAPVLLALFMGIVAGLDWWRYAWNLKPNPWVSSILALAVGVGAAIRVRLTTRRLRRLRLGRDGERAVAQYLEWFRTAGFFVFHDVPNERANVDHVLIGTRGVFTIETKTLAKPLRGECRIRVVGGKILANGRPLDRDPLVQAKAQARWFSNFLSEAGWKTFVQPVVVFPGWFVEPFDMKAEGVWALEPKALDKFIENQPERLTKDQVKAMASALSSFVRSKASF